jgi:hypothetical protein
MSLIVSGAFRQPDIDKSKRTNINNLIFTENTFNDIVRYYKLFSSCNQD